MIGTNRPAGTRATASVAAAMLVLASAAAPAAGAETVRAARQQTLTLVDDRGQSTVLELRPGCMPLNRQLRVVTAVNNSTLVAELFPTLDCSGGFSRIDPGQRARFSPPFPIASVGALRR
ncbi:hypothetical protein [Actinomadura rayongensis]|uniref:Uncharacterized protein n=1 Tax=Actinomadura rayongensis TaxID=1429076 RepID=A0A6I4WFX5_9ACTN|nr:hypothetical protein [Actinomadura rayongensis]MXQ65894.1 hypothetical protein [Actinomadura rayongensis]